MWIETDEGRTFIKKVSKELVVQVAPEELDLFDELIKTYFEDPHPPNLSATHDDDALEFGLGEIMAASTPAAAAVVSAVLTYILTEVIKTFQTESAKALSNKIEEFFKPDQKVEALTTEQMKLVSQLAYKQAKAFGLSSNEAKKMADALAGKLALFS